MFEDDQTYSDWEGLSEMDFEGGDDDMEMDADKEKEDAALVEKKDESIDHHHGGLDLTVNSTNVKEKRFQDFDEIFERYHYTYHNISNTIILFSTFCNFKCSKMYYSCFFGKKQFKFLVTKWERFAEKVRNAQRREKFFVIWPFMLLNLVFMVRLISKFGT